MSTELEHTEHILSAVYDRKKFIERFIGLTRYSWIYAKAQYHGICRMPVPFNDFDAVICGVLAVKPMTFSGLGKAIGLDVKENKAAEFLLQQAIKELKNREVLVCNRTVYELTDYGKHCQQRQTKPDTVKQDFELVFNATGGHIKNAHKIFANRPSEQVSKNRDCIENGLNYVEDVAAVQVPRVHCPEKDIQLLEYNDQRVSFYSTSFVVAILHNCRDNTLRALAFDEQSNEPIDALSDAIGADSNELKLVVEQIKKEGVYNFDFDKAESLSRSMNSWEFQQLKEHQIQRDKHLSDQQQRYDEAVAKSKKQAALVRSQIIQDQQLFDAIEFEKELPRVFETTNAEIWIVSPWLKKAALRLIPLIENYLKKGGKVFLCYSKAESRYDKMVDEKVLDTFRQLQDQYAYLYIEQSESPFHVKHLFLRNGEQPVHYTGSYNILSFNATHREYDYYYRRPTVINNEYAIRQEIMVKLAWTDETERAFSPYWDVFVHAYHYKAEDELFPLAKQIFDMGYRAYRDDYRWFHIPCYVEPSYTWKGRIERSNGLYRDYERLLAYFQATPKLFVPQDERKEMIKQLRALKLDYLKPFNQKDCNEIISFREKVLELLLEMNKLEN